MAPSQPDRYLSSSLNRRADGSGGYESTPEGIIVPVVIILLLLIGAAITSIHTYWQRRRRNDQDFDTTSPSKASRKRLPEWLSNWLDTSKLRSSRSSPEIPQTHKFDLAKSSTGDLTTENRDSDTIALRPVSVYLPTYPLSAYEPYDRYPSVVAAGGQDLRPKVIGAPLR